MLKVCLVLFLLIVTLEIYEFFRKKYEVFGIIIDPEHGARGVDKKYFRSRKKALDCLDEYKKTYFNAVMEEVF